VPSPPAPLQAPPCASLPDSAPTQPLPDLSPQPPTCSWTLGPSGLHQLLTWLPSGYSTPLYKPAFYCSGA
uniref:Uncharacterized protein n=1 Tax=Equus caballus TaxID=9796 RepID=A0A9L0SLM0_HORSE